MLHRKIAAVIIALLSVSTALAGGPLEFLENRGQWDGPFRYRALTPHGDVYLQDRGFTIVVGDAANDALWDAYHHGQTAAVTLRYHAYRAQFEGSTTPVLHSSKVQSWYHNYFLGADSSRWKTGIHPCLAVDYDGLYPGIGLHVGSEGGNLKYELTVAAGADPAPIRLHYEGADGLAVKGGRLQVKTSVGTVEEAEPVAYQWTATGRKKVPCYYRVRDSVLTYELPEGWDRSLPLVIDPTVVFSSLTGSTADNWGFTATYDAAGNFYSGGVANNTGGSFPVSTGAFQTTYGGAGGPAGETIIPGDMALIKYNPSGTAKIWATYCGGSATDQPHSMFVDTAGNLVVAGRSFSSNYPVTAGAFDGTANGAFDIVVTKFNSTGTALLGSTYIGGSGNDGVNIFSEESAVGSLKFNYGDDARSEVILDRAGNVYLAGSSSSTNFPVTAGAAQGTKSGQQDGVVMKLTPNLTALTWCTYLGGSGDDAAYVLALDTGQTALYVGGGTASSNFPMPAGGLNAGFQGGLADGYIVRYQNGGTYALQKGTFLGKTSYDQCYGVQTDLENGVYVMGQTLGGTFPVTSGVYSNPGSTQFIIKLNPDLSTNVFSTVFGSGPASNPNISPVAFLVDTCQNIYISGWGGTLTGVNPNSATTSGMPTAGLISTPLKSTTDGQDFYFFVLNKNAQSLLYGAYFGSNGGVGEHVDGGTSRFSRDGVIYQAVCAACGGSQSFPTTPGAFSTGNGSSNCNLGSVKIAFNLGAVDAIAQANPTARGCPPLTVNFGNTSSNATAYTWDFGDNSTTSTLATPSHVYTQQGTYTARLIAENPNACKVRDTVYLTIIVDTNRTRAGYSYKVIDSCGPYRVQFTDTSKLSATPAGTTYLWIYGDGSTSTGPVPGIHSYPDSGTYTVLLVLTDPTACNSPDTVRKTIYINARRVRAAFNGPDSVCLSSSGSLFVSLAQNAATLLWRFGDGTTSTAPSPQKLYAVAGTYTVTLVAANPATCNKIDSVSRPIKVKSLPKADFDYAPLIPISNTPIDFINRSQNAVSYFWGLGDGSSTTETNPSHLYKRTGTYTVCLTATSADGCRDTLCKKVDADVRTACDVPSAFSPNGDGTNDVLYVRAAALETLDFKVFNRWGQLVFQTDDKDRGWDGTFNGKPQEMEAYAYTLSATFIDGTSARKTGNVTLLR